MNKKIVILVVVVECILAILLISVLGLAIESIFSEVNAQEIFFTTDIGEVIEQVPSSDGKGWKSTTDGRLILTPGTLYREKEKRLEWLPTEDHEEADAKKDIIFEFYNPEKVRLNYVIMPANTTENTVTFTCNDPDVEIEGDGTVHFYGDEIHSVQITVRTKNGKSATIWLSPKKNTKPNPVVIQ